MLTSGPTSKHKVTMSTDLTQQNGGQPMPSVPNKNAKSININAMTYDRIKGLTPVGTKGQNGQALKNQFHLHN